MPQEKSRFNSRGFSFVEVMISMAILTVVSLGVAQLFAVATKVNMVARGQTSTTLAAEHKMEQIRSLSWGYDASGLPVSDTSSDLSVSPTTQSGRGLEQSPADSLEKNTAGFADYVDAGGAWVGSGATQPATAVYIRRWSIQPLPTNPNNTLVIQVLVTPIANEGTRLVSSNPRVRMPGDTLLVTVKTRKAS
jgi:prepilin-type N-terminal cleavage/methylation domain-containing protein